MNEEHRRKVKNYLKRNGTAPIRFSISRYNDYYHNDPEARKQRILKLKELRANCQNLSLDELIVKIIELAEHFGTIYCKAKRLQCVAGARRTAPDIWKIVTNYDPKYTIFDVMHTLYQLAHKSNLKMITSWCNTIDQRTFRLDTRRQIYDIETPDEFGIYFNDWRNI